MLDKNRIDKFEEYGATAALKLRGEIVTALKEQILDTLRDVRCYFEDRKTKKSTIAGRVEELKEQLAALEAKVAEYGPRLAEATLSCNSTALGVIQTELTNLEAQKAAVAAQIGLLSGVSVYGDEALFTKADEKARVLNMSWTETMKDLSALADFANNQMTLWSQVADLSTLGGDLMSHNSVFNQVEEMRRDFREVE